MDPTLANSQQQENRKQNNMRYQHNDNWQQQAKCVGKDPRAWDLLELRGGDSWDARAREVCRGCPVIKDCAADALEPLCIGTVRAGVWIPAAAGLPTAPGYRSRALAIEKLIGVIESA